jgi:hypothetical protein
MVRAVISEATVRQKWDELIIKKKALVLLNFNLLLYRTRQENAKRETGGEAPGIREMDLN